MNFRCLLSVFCMLAGFLATQPALADTNATAPAPKLVSHTYGGWVYQCAETPVADKPDQTSCQILKQIALTQDGKTIPMAIIFFQKAPKDQGYLLSSMVPLNVLLAPGVTFFGDKMSPVNKAITFCRPDSCVVTPQSADGLVEEFKASDRGHLSFVQLNGQSILFTFPLLGFSDALKALDSGVPPKA